ncbi:MAG: hypothetical protein ABR975_05920 [Vulcanimicrobiaceae bacterium]
MVPLMLALALTAGCAGGGRALPAGPPGSAAPTGTTRGPARFMIVVPKATSSAASSRRSPRYVSPATQSIAVAITTDPGGTSVVNETAGLTPTSNGCSSTLASTICTLSIALGPGSYNAAISTYDGASGTGNELSQGQLVDFTIAEGEANAITLTLSGIPAALKVAGETQAVQGSQGVGFTLQGAAAQKFIVEALDPDGNIIVGPGAPTFTAALASGSGFAIANPASTTPNTLILTPPTTSGQNEIFTLTAAYGDSTCSVSGAVCTTSFSVTSHLQTLFVANNGGSTVSVYAPPYSGAHTSVSNGVGNPDALALNAAGDLFVANNNGTVGTVTEYAPPYTGAPAVTISSADPNFSPIALAMTSGGDLMIADNVDNAVTEYVPPYSGAATTTITANLNSPSALVVNSAGNLFVMNQGSNNVKEYASPYTGSPTTISGGLNDPQQMAIASSGELFLSNGNSTLAAFTPPYSGSAATNSQDLDAPAGLAADVYGDVFVASEFSNAVLEYAAPYTGAPIANITNSVNAPRSVTLDDAGNLFVANEGNFTVTEYAPPYTGSPTVNISTGITDPVVVLLSP